MSAVTNRRIVLASRPRGAADLACFRLESVPLAPLREGELLLRTVYLSLDPYMRGRMSDAPSYAAPVAVGAVMIGQTVAVVVASRHPRWHAGDRVLADSGWQEYEVSTGRSLVKLSADMEPASYALGVLGMPGFTAFVGLLDIGKPQPGETLGGRRSHRRRGVGRRPDREIEGLPCRRHRRRSGQVRVGRARTRIR